jgi:CHAT domain-containing protein
MQGTHYDNLGQAQKALDCFNQALKALPTERDPRYPSSEAIILSSIAKVYDHLGQEQQVLSYLKQALAALPAEWNVAHPQLETVILANIGETYDKLGQEGDALEFCNRALSISQDSHDPVFHAHMLNTLGLVENHLGQNLKALDHLTQALRALPAEQPVDVLKLKSGILNNTALVYSALGQTQNALDYQNQAIALYHATGDRLGEAMGLNNIGEFLDELGQEEEALNSFDKAWKTLPTEPDLRVQRGEATILNNIAKVNCLLGQMQRALDHESQALLLYQATGDRRGEGIGLGNIATIYDDLGQEEKALESLDKALTIARELPDQTLEARTLSGIALVHYLMKQNQKALDDLKEAFEALPTERNNESLKNEAEILTASGTIYSALGQKQNAMKFYKQAFPIAAILQDPFVKGWVFTKLMESWRDAGYPALAVFYGKAAVNAVQQVRRNIQGLDKELQKKFVASNQDVYHELADLLIDQGRLPEAQQVLDLMKQEEYSEFVRSQAANALNPVTLTPAERQAELEYEQSTAKIVAEAEQLEQLKEITSRTKEQEDQYQMLSNDVDNATKEFADIYYKRLNEIFARNSALRNQLSSLRNSSSDLQVSIAKTLHTVALYTLSTEDRYRVIVITGSTMVARQYPIKRNELDKKILAFRAALKQPDQDPKPQANELYRILIGPVQADLDQTQAQVLVLALDGVLRYMPVAALYDGKQYLVEKYSTVSITPDSDPHLADKPQVANLDAVAMGISRKYEDDLGPLPAVEGELNDIVHDPQVKDAHGLLQGTILLNNQFTEKAMEDQLGTRHPVVHIASHFVFEPGDYTHSYLLLAGKDNNTAGYHLTVADFQQDAKLTLAGTDLLTLSACETGMIGNDSNGREVDGVGITAQRKGAKSVISSLWSVNDSSTSSLMVDFYQRWAGGKGNMTKVEALRQAQLDLLLGKIKPKPDFANPNAPTSFAHPYYWAPFVLMGNWR